MARMLNRKCKVCGTEFVTSYANAKRGWGLFCSKSCKAHEQEKRTGQYRDLLNAGHEPFTGFDGDVNHKFG